MADKTGNNVTAENKTPNTEHQYLQMMCRFEGQTKGH
jgi:hypothetical protein